jgi:hypothetical protein
MKITKITLIACGVLLSACGVILFCMQRPETCSIWPTTNVIKPIQSFEQAADILKTADKNSLVLFDVDDTLIIPATVLFRPITIENPQYNQWLKELTDSALKNAKQSEEYYGSIWKQQETPKIIELGIVNTIASLQNRGVMVLALTALMTGSSGIIPSLPEWRFTKLKEVGIDFSKANLPDIVFTELPAKNGQHPMLYHGILCATSGSKGQVLGAFLDRMGLKPNKVIFFDDSLKRVEDVGQEMKKRNIPFYGFQYKGADFVPGELDKEIASFQYKYLLEHEKWLSDDEAREMLQHKK